MMRTLSRISLMASLTLALLSCSRAVESAYVALPYVDALVASSGPDLKGLAAISGQDSGTIVLIGDPKDCLEVSEELMLSDKYDNVDGSRRPDGLPDFSGENICSILDFHNAPYDSVIVLKDSVALREMAIRDCVHALDTSFHYTPFGDKVQYSKGSPKVLLVCSQVVAGCAMPDIEDFFTKIGCDIPVLAAADSSYSFPEALFSLMRERNIFTHDIAYPVANGYILVPIYGDSGAEGVKSTLFDEAYLPLGYSDTLAVIAPKTIDSYVQK